MVLESLPKGIFCAEFQDMAPRFYSEGDESAGQLPSPSVIFAKAEIQKYNQSSMDPRFYSEGDEGAGQHPSQSVIFAKAEIQKDN